MLIQCKTVQ